ncbi:putative pre-mRNA-splicing factor ATP-dependent RNA helicase DHX32 [Xenopus laevis]|uniref:Putative pre-mRNA-splicing factor ATP-dependent RNA helicase DHX32 n=1 Tax=Xenopus laevis TaxID=8355 RepID=DHX32_XENLA|nr:putative pre-mRNA-splicing factor ATP-dependent RNA helicase DHX32 [Xenopus laevis]Q5XH12.1 RecName: Full=Putative pre-mRNA-splicing factor ATP-dependent RNA helicase DHX32 [Xenopus laevis]AAH84264.1 LOC495093 protein [Xenopus laevis]
MALSLEAYEQDIDELISDEKSCCLDVTDSSDVEGDELNDLELNPFDGLPYSSRFYKLLKERETLPIWKIKYDFLEHLAHNQIVVVSAGPKSGKSSQIPQWCAEYCLAGHYQHGAVVCTQAHKQTAVWLAMRVADEMDVNIGHEVGYIVPFENCCTSETILRYCTDEMLRREMMSNPLLSSYGVVIIDDVYERFVSTDVLLSFLKVIAVSRPELKVVIITCPSLSGTLVSYYGNAPLVEAENTHSVESVYTTSLPRDYFHSALRLLFEIHHTKEKGDIVVFLACEEEIKRAYEHIKQEALHMNPELGELMPIALYPHQSISDYIPYEELDDNSKNPKRKVVLTTSLGESLIWMKNIFFVIDVGIEKRKVYNTRIRAESLVTQPISKVRAKMRKHILSSSSEGKLFCLYPEDFAHEMKPFLTAKVEECNLISMVLFLKRMDIAGLAHCDFINRPDPESLMQALEDLDYLAALDNDGNLSEFGIIMSEFPLDPQLSKSILAACEFDCVDEMLTLAAMVTAPNCFIDLPPEAKELDLIGKGKFFHPEGDHFTLINIYNEYEQMKRNNASQYDVEKWCQNHCLSFVALEMARAIRNELLDIMRRIELPLTGPAFGSDENVTNIKKSLLSGYFMQIARDVDGLGNYIMLTHKQVGQLHPDSGFCNSAKVPEWVLFHEFSVSERSCIRIVSEISPNLFMEFVPPYYFSNLPPSETKDLLQQDQTPDTPPTEEPREEEPLHEANDEGTAEQRCIIQ